ncbi:hypothetical protein BDY19DRAFT_995018 [Irpex rosettiformis]|uniref:Uncharacterized protein n=1 Tax=Irpex rosettiformis TaxID=378272 RepID=A0ACB8TZ61_9APHY|nr:hypothetical protein BDY19DRAFT_995018 [Irpex rosettiformis]
MAPKFSNPHLSIQQATQIVSRAGIKAEHDGMPTVYPETGDALQDDLQTLEGLLKRSIGEFQLDIDAQSNSSNKAEERKHRRGKVAKIELPEEEEIVCKVIFDDIFYRGSDDVYVLAFRLFSNAPPKTVSLKPKPAPEVNVSERSCEDDDREALKRAERAKAAAVDSNWILKESQIPTYPSRLNNDKKIIHVSLNGRSDSPPPLMVAEIPRLPRNNAPGLPRSSLKLPEKEKPSPHDFPADKICCPVIQVSTHSTDSPDPQKKTKRRRKNTSAMRQPPSFFRPLREWGGHSAGYALGYEGSRPVPIGSTRQWGYRRDSMRSGTISKWSTNE